jgi:hypothetical protein
MTIVWWVLSEQWAATWGTKDSSAVQGWAATGWKIVLIAFYAIAIAILIYVYFSE